MINERTDIYNFGAAMYRLVAWKLPQTVVSDEEGEKGAVLGSKLFARLYKPVEEVNPRTPPALAELINRCLSYEAHKRPERMSEVQNTLDHLCDELVTSPDDSLESM